MFVSDRMSRPATTVAPEASFQEAIHQMHQGHLRRLPVVDRHGKLVGIVSERDLLLAMAAQVTASSEWAEGHLPLTLKVEQLMTRPVIAVTPDMPIEEAARCMVEHRIGGLPVVDSHQHVIGMITESDIFKAFVEMLGSDQHGLRLTLRVGQGKSVLANLATAISLLEGNILSLGTFGGGTQGDAYVLVKVTGVREDRLVKTLESIGDHVVDVREV